MKGKLIAGLIVSAAVIIGAAFAVSSIDSTKQGVTNKVVVSKAVSSGNNQGQTTSNNNVVGSSNIDTTNSVTGSRQNSNSQLGITGGSKSLDTSQRYNNSSYIDPQNTLKIENNNKLSSYLGTWEVSKNVGHSIEGMTGDAPSLIGSKVEITKDTYSFEGVTMNNPYYYVQSISARDLFGQDGATGVLGNQEKLDRLIVSSKPLTDSEVQNMPLNNLNPTIILNDYDIYVFGGGKNHAQIDSVSQQSSSVSGTNGSNSIGNSSSNTKSISSSKIVVQNAEQAMALVAKKIGTTGKNGKIVWSYMSNGIGPAGALMTGNNNIKFYIIRGDYESFIKHREEVHGCGSYDGLDYYVLQNGTIVKRSSAEGQRIFV